MIRVKYTKYKPHGAYLRLSNEHYILDADDRSGVLKGLYLTRDAQGTNFMGNEQNMRLNVWWKQRYVPEKHMRTPMYCWTGDVVLKARSGEAEAWHPMHTFLSDDVRSVSYDDRSITTRYAGESANPGGLRGLGIEQTYRLCGDAIVWSVTVENTSSDTLQIGELGLPIILNAECWRIGDEQQGFNHRSVDSARHVYEQRALDSFFVSGHSSYILGTRASGKGDHLLFIVQGDTALEAVASDGLFPRTEMMTAVGPVFYLFSEATAKQPWYNGHRSLTLSPGAKREFSFKICRARDYADIDEKLYANGNIAVKVAPGMVLPTGVTGHLLLRCRKPIRQIETSDGIEVKADGQLGHRHRYTVHLRATGQQKVTVRYGHGEWMNLLFNGIEPVESLIKARARFIVEKQRVEDPDDRCRCSFRIWNNQTDTLATLGQMPCSIIDMGGSDDRCFAPPVFLSGKNVYYPEERQIRALDEFVEKFLYGKLQDTETFEVKNGLYDSDETYKLLKGTEAFETISSFLVNEGTDEETTWRAWNGVSRIYNYPHAYNVYYNMYRITKLHGVATTREPKEYLYFAYRTALASYLDSTYESVYQMKNYMDYHRGNMSRTHAPMGSPILARMLESLQAEGMEDEHRILSETIKDRLPFFVEEEYPFPSEYCFGHASHAAVYYLAQVADDERLKRTTVATILAARDAAPLWFAYATNQRFIGCYPTPLLARPLLDRYEQTRDEYLLRMGYGAMLAVWSCVDPSGKGYNGREWRFNPPDKGSPEYNYYRNGCFSGELGMGLYGNLGILKSYLVRDPDFGLVGYGCEVSETADAYTLEPWDGLGVRAFVEPMDVHVETVRAGMEHVTVAKDRSGADIRCRRPYPGADAGRVCLRGMPAGRYAVRAGEGEQELETDDGTLACVVPLEKKATEIRVRLTSKAR